MENSENNLEFQMEKIKVLEDQILVNCQVYLDNMKNLLC